MSVESVKQDLRTKKEQVGAILEQFPSSRNSDAYLTILWLREYGNLSVKIPFIPWSDIERIRFESIRRVRQLFNKDGQYVATDPRVLRQRQRLSKAWRKAIPQV